MPRDLKERGKNKFSLNEKKKKKYERKNDKKAQKKEKTVTATTTLNDADEKYSNRLTKSVPTERISIYKLIMFNLINWTANDLRPKVMRELNGRKWLDCARFGLSSIENVEDREGLSCERRPFVRYYHYAMNRFNKQ